MVAFPFANVALTTKKPLSTEYPTELGQVGDYIRAHRLNLGLTQKQAATQLGVSEAALFSWERGGREPGIRNWPGIIAFLGGYPLGEESEAEQLLARRRRGGLTQLELALELGADEGTIRRREQAKTSHKS